VAFLRPNRTVALIVALSGAALHAGVQPPQLAIADAIGAADVPTLDWIQPAAGVSASGTSALAVSTDGSTVYASTYTGQIDEFSVATGQLIGQLSTGLAWLSHDMLSLTAAGSGLYALTCNYIALTHSSGCNYGIWRIDPLSGSVTQIAEMPGTTDARPDNNCEGPLVVSPDEKWAYVATDDDVYRIDITSQTLESKPNSGFRMVARGPGDGAWLGRNVGPAPSTAPSSLNLIDTAGNSVKTVTLPVGTFQAFVRPDLQHAVIAVQSAAQSAAGTVNLSIVDLKTGAVQTVTDLPSAGLTWDDSVLSGDGSWLYVDNNSRLIGIDLSSGAISTVDKAPSPSVPVRYLRSPAPAVGAGFFALSDYAVDQKWFDSAIVHYAPHSATSTPPLVGTPPVLAQVGVGDTATLTTANWSTSPDSLSYQWYADFQPIAGADQASLTITPDLASQPVFAAITATAAGFTESTIVTNVIRPTPLTLETSTPTINGTPALGQTLSASPGAWTEGTAFTYQWRVSGNAIPHATASTFVVGLEEEGETISVDVTGSLQGYATATKTSASTAKVPVVAYRPNVAPALAGPDRYATAVAISQDSYPAAGSAKTVVVTSGEDFPDALSAAPAAVKLGGPLLLTLHDRLLPSVAAEVQRLGPQHIVIVGGPAAVGAAVLTALTKIAPTVRISGATRYDTSLAVAKYAFGTSNVPSVFFATGTQFADALSAGAYAGAAGMPVLLVPGNAATAPAPLLAWMKNARTTDLHIVGGYAAITQAVAMDIEDAGGDGALIYQGDDRFGTNVQVNYSNGGVNFYASADTAFLASGLNYPDALAGAAAAGKAHLPLYLVKTGCTPAETVTIMRSTGIATVRPLGGASAVGSGATKMAICAG
jgi:putative cell wall-binding protein